MCKRVFRFELQFSSYWQNIKFSRNCPKFHKFTQIVIFKVYLHLFRSTASSLSISWQRHVRNTLFHCCQLWAVKLNVLCQEHNLHPGLHPDPDQLHFPQPHGHQWTWTHPAGFKHHLGAPSILVTNFLVKSPTKSPISNHRFFCFKSPKCAI